MARSARWRRSLGPHPERLEPELDVLAHRQPRQQGEALEHHGHAGVGAVEGLTPVADLARGGRDQPGDAAQQRALPRAGAAEQGHDLPLPEVERDVVEHRERAAVGRDERLGDVGDLDDGGRSRRPAAARARLEVVVTAGHICRIGRAGSTSSGAHSVYRLSARR